MDDDYQDVVAIEVCHVQKPIVWVEGNANWFRTTDMVATTSFREALVCYIVGIRKWRVYP
jgi:hypothetical protein